MISRTSRERSAPLVQRSPLLHAGLQIELGQLTPIAFTERTASRCAAKARQFQDMLGVPLLLENIAYYMGIPGGAMTEAEFLSKVVTTPIAASCSISRTSYVNARNLRYDPYEFIDQIPLERVVQVHLAGGTYEDGMWVDTHDHPVDSHPEVWDLLDYLCRRAPVRGVLIERDANPPDDFGEMLAEVEHARAIWA